MTVNSEDLSNHHPSISDSDRKTWHEICPFTHSVNDFWNRWYMYPVVWPLNETSLVALSHGTIYFSPWNLETLLINFFFILVTVEMNPVINLNISKLVTQVLGNILNFLIWKGTTSCICCGLMLSLIYIYIFKNCFKVMTMPYHSLPYPKKQKENNKFKPWTTKFTFLTTLIFNVTLSLFLHCSINPVQQWPASSVTFHIVKSSWIKCW